MHPEATEYSSKKDEKSSPFKRMVNNSKRGNKHTSNVSMEIWTSPISLRSLLNRTMSFLSCSRIYFRTIKKSEWVDRHTGISLLSESIFRVVSEWMEVEKKKRKICVFFQRNKSFHASITFSFFFLNFMFFKLCIESFLSLYWMTVLMKMMISFLIIKINRQAPIS